jgi:predicted ArsR family transcriptional regulator
MSRDFEAGARAVAALEDGLRRDMYRFIRERGAPVSREEAAGAVGISRKLAAFHLDKLVDRGLLRFHYARPPGRSGRGAGRTAKLYEPSDLEVEISIPERRYDLVADLLVKAVQEEAPGERADETARRVAQRGGMELGQSVARDMRLRPPGHERTLSVTKEVLARHGYEPYRDKYLQVGLRNCPFLTVAREAPEVVCDMNRAFIEGLVRGLGNDTVQVILDPAPGRCCVRLQKP